MTRRFLHIGCGLALAAGSLTSAQSWAQDLIVYPKADQSQEQQQKDEYECYQFAKGNSNFDPMAMPTASSAPPAKAPSTGQTAFRGAALGTAVGAIANGKSGAKKGAGIGGVSGLLMGGARSSDNKKQQDQWQQQQQQQYLAGRNNYNRAYAACMEGRDYSVR
jgi:hypothetical protein